MQSFDSKKCPCTSVVRDRQVLNKLLAADDEFSKEFFLENQTVSARDRTGRAKSREGKRKDRDPTDVLKASDDVTGWIPDNKVLRKPERENESKSTQRGYQRDGRPSEAFSFARDIKPKQEEPYVFRHYADIRMYIEQYRRDHTSALPPRINTLSYAFKPELLELKRLFCSQNSALSQQQFIYPFPSSPITATGLTPVTTHAPTTPVQMPSVTYTLRKEVQKQGAHADVAALAHRYRLSPSVYRRDSENSTESENGSRRVPSDKPTKIMGKQLLGKVSATQQVWGTGANKTVTSTTTTTPTSSGTVGSVLNSHGKTPAADAPAKTENGTADPDRQEDSDDSNKSEALSISKLSTTPLSAEISVKQKVGVKLEPSCTYHLFPTDTMLLGASPSPGLAAKGSMLWNPQKSSLERRPSYKDIADPSDAGMTGPFKSGRTRDSAKVKTTLPRAEPSPLAASKEGVGAKLDTSRSQPDTTDVPTRPPSLGVVSRTSTRLESIKAELGPAGGERDRDAVNFTIQGVSKFKSDSTTEERSASEMARKPPSRKKRHASDDHGRLRGSWSAASVATERTSGPGTSASLTPTTATPTTAPGKTSELQSGGLQGSTPPGMPHPSPMPYFKFWNSSLPPRSQGAGGLKQRGDKWCINSEFNLKHLAELVLAEHNSTESPDLAVVAEPARLSDPTRQGPAIANGPHLLAARAGQGLDWLELLDSLRREGQLPASLPVSSLLASLACQPGEGEEGALQGPWTMEHHRVWESRCRRHLAEQSKLKRVPEGASISDLQLSGLTWLPPGGGASLTPAPGPQPQFARNPRASPPPWEPARATCPPPSQPASSQPKEAKLASARQESPRPKWPSSSSAFASLPKHTRMILSALEGSPSQNRLSSPPTTPASSRPEARRGKAGDQSACDARVDRELSRLLAHQLNAESMRANRSPSLLAENPAASEFSSSVERQSKASLSVRDTSFAQTASTSSSFSSSSSAIPPEVSPRSLAERHSRPSPRKNHVSVQSTHSGHAQQDHQACRPENGSSEASGSASGGPCSVSTSTAVPDSPRASGSEVQPNIPDAAKPVSDSSVSASSTRSQTSQSSTRPRQLASLIQPALASSSSSPPQPTPVLDSQPPCRPGLGSRQRVFLSSGDVTSRRRLGSEEAGRDCRSQGRRRKVADPLDVALGLGLGYRAASLVGNLRAPSTSEEKQRSRLSRTLARDPVLSSLANSLDPSCFDTDIPSKSGDVSSSRQGPFPARHGLQPALSERSLPDGDPSAAVSSKTSSIQLSAALHPQASISKGSHSNVDILKSIQSLATDIGLCSSAEFSQLQACAKGDHPLKGVSTSGDLDSVDGCTAAGFRCHGGEGEEAVPVAGKEDDVHHDQAEAKSCRLAITNLTPFSPSPSLLSPQQHPHAKRDGHLGSRPPPCQASIAKAAPFSLETSSPFDCSVVGRAVAPQGEEDGAEERDPGDHKDSGGECKSAPAAGISLGHLRTGLAILAPTAPSIGSRCAGSFCRDLVVEAAALGVSDGGKSSELPAPNLRDDQTSTESCTGGETSRKRKDCSEPPLGIYGDLVTEPPSVQLLDRTRGRRRVQSGSVSSASKPSLGDCRPATTRRPHATVRRSGSRKIISIQMPSVLDNFGQREDTVASTLAADENLPDGKARASEEDNQGSSSRRRSFRRLANQDISAFSRNFTSQAEPPPSDASLPRAPSDDSHAAATPEGGSATEGKAPGGLGPTSGAKPMRRSPELPGEKGLFRKQDREAFRLWRLAHLPMPPHPVLPSRAYTFLLPCRRSGEDST